MSGKKKGGESAAIGGDQPQVSVGIDLGTTYSCVAAWKNGRVEIIPNDQGNRITPSCVAFTDRQRFVGDSAFNQIATNPANTIFDAKRLIGRTYGDREVQSDMKLWPFRVVSGDQGKPMIAVRYKGEEKRFAAEEISSMVLGKMKQCAEAYLDAPVRKAVITVPAYFNDSQRQATKDAGTIAGLDVMRIINEPTAAAIAYGLDGKESGRTGRRNVLIFDLGGGTFDVSILEVEDGILEVKATAGDTHLGGEDFDQRLVEFFARDFGRRHRADISGNPKALRRLRTACERAKRSLQHSAQATVEVDSLHEGMDYYCALSRAKFEELNMDLFLRCMETVKHCLRDARMDKSSIDDLVLVGGSTRILKVQELLRELFDGKQLSNSVNPDEAVAFGAAVQAAMLEETVVDLVLRDVAPLSLGIETHGEIMSVVIPRNTPVPTVKEEVFTTTQDWQTKAVLPVYEGERRSTRDNKRLGTFNIVGLASAPAGVTKFTVRFALDDNGILHASAAEHGTRNKAETVITNERGALSAVDIEMMVRDAERYREEDEEMERKVQARNELERFVYSVKGSASRTEVVGRMSEAERKAVVEAVARCFEWMGENELPEARECERMRTALERAWTPIVTKLMRGRT